MKAVIIEDETTAVNSLKAILAQNTVTQIEVIAELESIEESVDFFRTSPHPDIIFMDIHLADGSAFKIFEQVEIDAPVVFTTAYDEYALQAFQVSSIDYLLKPVTLASLERALNKLRLFDTEERLAHIRQTNRTIQSRHTIKSLLIMLADKFYPLAVEEILYFYTANEKVTAYTPRRKTTSHRPYPRRVGRATGREAFLPGQPSIHHFTQRHQGYRSLVREPPVRQPHLSCPRTYYH